MMIIIPTLPPPLLLTTTTNNNHPICIQISSTNVKLHFLNLHCVMDMFLLASLLLYKQIYIPQKSFPHFSLNKVILGVFSHIFSAPSAKSQCIMATCKLCHFPVVPRCYAHIIPPACSTLISTSSPCNGSQLCSVQKVKKRIMCLEDGRKGMKHAFILICHDPHFPSGK